MPHWERLSASLAVMPSLPMALFSRASLRVSGRAMLQRVVDVLNYNMW